MCVVEREGFLLDEVRQIDRCSVVDTAITEGSNFAGDSGCVCRTSLEVTGMTRPGKIPTEKAGIKPASAALEADALTTILTRRWTGPPRWPSG